MLSLAGATALYVDSTNVYLNWSDALGAHVAAVDKETGVLGPDYAYAGSIVLAQDASQFYFYESIIGGTSSATKICVVAKQSMRAVGSCLYAEIAPQGVAVAISGTSLWWLDASNTVWMGTTSGAAPVSVYQMAGQVLASDSTGVVWSDGGGKLVAQPVGISSTVYVATPPSQQNPGALVLDSGFAYWYNSIDGAIYRAHRDGSPGIAKLAVAAHQPGQFALDSSYLYWTDPTTGSVWRVPIAGGTQATTIATDQTNVSGVAADDAAIYWSTYDRASGSGQLFELAK